jgi:hypothetical protein
VITEQGEGRTACYQKQKAFLRAVCEPVLRSGGVPVVKVHPLYARYHGAEDLRSILEGLAGEDDAYQSVVVTEEPYWTYAFTGKAVVTFGSSGVYELYAAGIRRVLVCNFLGKQRASEFSFFEPVFIRSEEEYRSLFGDDEALEKRFARFTGLHGRVYEAYASLNTGQATASVLSEIIRS